MLVCLLALIAGSSGLQPLFADSAADLETFMRGPKRDCDAPTVAYETFGVLADHHLRNSGGGFPEERAVSEVNCLSELIGLSHDMLEAVRAAKIDKKINPVKLLRARAPESFSEPVVNAFIRTFEKL